MENRQPKQHKSKSQVFLNQSWPCQKITELLNKSHPQSVLEIGPGGGILTKELLKAGFKVTAVEKDGRFVDHLEEGKSKHGFFTHPEALSIVHANILDFDFGSWLQTTPGPHYICGNIPYQISSQIVMKSLEVITQVSGIVFLVQKEFGERVTSPKQTKSYGSLSIYCQLRSQAKLEFIVPSTCFRPVPKVDSAVISFKKPKLAISPERLEQVEKITRKTFTQRRKMLSNSLGSYQADQEDLKKTIDLSRRCDSLSPQEFLELSYLIYPDPKD